MSLWKESMFIVEVLQLLIETMLNLLGDGKVVDFVRLTWADDVVTHCPGGLFNDNHMYSPYTWTENPIKDVTIINSLNSFGTQWSLLSLTLDIRIEF
jgi:hypothetical protein